MPRTTAHIAATILAISTILATYTAITAHADINRHEERAELAELRSTVELECALGQHGDPVTFTTDEQRVARGAVVAETMGYVDGSPEFAMAQFGCSSGLWTGALANG